MVFLDIVHLRVYHGTYNTDVKQQKDCIAKKIATAWARVRGSREDAGGPQQGEWGRWPRGEKSSCG